MICKFCGSKVEKGVPCPNCGAMQHIEDETELQTPEPQEAQPQGLYRDENGAYHWEYRTSSFSNPAVLVYLLRSVFAFGVFVALVQLMLWAGNGCDGDIVGTLLFVGKCTVGLLVFSAVLWVILMLIKGPRVIARYTMDEDKIAYMTDPVRKGRREVDFVRYSYDLTGDGRIPSKWERLTSEYWKVKKIKPVRRKNLIWVNLFLQKSTIFVPQEHYDFVYEYITSRCPHAKIKLPVQPNADRK